MIQWRPRRFVQISWRIRALRVRWFRFRLRVGHAAWHSYSAICPVILIAMSRSHADADANKGEQVSLRSNFNAGQMGYSCNKSNRSAGSLREETPSTSTGNQRDARTFKRLVHLTGRSLTVHAIRDGDRTNIKNRCGMGICELAHTQIRFLWYAGGGTPTSGGLTETRDGDGRFGAQQRPKSRGAPRTSDDFGSNLAARSRSHERPESALS